MKNTKRLISLLLALLLLCMQAAALAAPKLDFSAFRSSGSTEAREAIKLWEASDGQGWARWENAGNNKLAFHPKVYNHSDHLTMKSVKLYYYATDKYGDNIYDTTYYHVTDLKLRPGEKEYTDFVALPNRNKIVDVYCGIKEVHYTNGDSYVFDDDDISYHYWTVR